MRLAVEQSEIAHINLASAYCEQNRPSEAIEEFHHGLEA